MSSSPLFRRSALALALVATGALAVGAAVAGPQEKHVRMHHAMGEMHGEFFATVDADGDGAISQAEFDAIRGEHVDAMDTNRDGLVSFAEHEAAREARAEQRFVARHDQDDDGRVSVAELSARAESHFARMDRNDDGQVTQDEMRQGKRRDHGPGRHE